MAGSGISFSNSDERLMELAEKATRDRRDAGLEGLTGGLEAVVINCQPLNLQPAVRETLATTGLHFDSVFESDQAVTCVLKRDNSADFLLRSRKSSGNPFSPYNKGPKAEALPDTRLETFIYKCRDVYEYHRLQTERGVRFLTDGVVETPDYLYVETHPSIYTGNSLGFIQWRHREGRYVAPHCRNLDWTFEKPDLAYLDNISYLDHSAARVRAQDRDPAILEFMSLTSYRFEFAIYVESLNSITNVARLSLDDYAQVFTSGIKPFAGLDESGPTEKYIHNYGTRVHHIAFHTERIEETFQGLKDNGMEFLVELVGSPEDGLKQTFSQPSPNTLLVHEYIHRYGGFDGFFTKSNVTELTRATDKQ